MAKEQDKSDRKQESQQTAAEDAQVTPTEGADDASADQEREPAVEAPEDVRVEPELTAPPLSEGVHYIWGTGRRKKAIARVRIRPGTGKFLINKREINDYFTQDRDRRTAVSPLMAVDMLRAWDIWVNVGGGGFAGQAGAVTLGLARALVKAVPQREGKLREKGLLTRDARMSERKKYGQKGARKRFQFSKR